MALRSRGVVRPVTETLIGREEELASIASFLDGVATGACALVFEGEAGIGKTALWRAALTSARERSQRVLSCGAAASEARSSWVGLGDLLQDALVEAEPLLPPPQRRALRVALLLEDAEVSPPDGRAVAIAFVGVLRALAASGPLIVAVDDTQWLDRPSAMVLQFAARRVGEEPIGLLFTSRSQGAAHPPLGLDRALAEERLVRIRLAPLGLPLLQQLLQARLGCSFSRATLHRLADASGGNPFFALEIGRALIGSGITLCPGEALPIPATLGELVRGRLHQLPVTTRLALLAASAVSQPTVRLVRELVGDARRTRSALARAAAAEVVELDGCRIRFTHPFFASAVYAAAPLEQRRRLHRRLAEVITDVEESARHRALAARAPAAAVAAALDEAAARAHARGAPAAAAELSEEALRLTARRHVEELRRRHLDAASYELEAGDVARARALLEEAVALSPPGVGRAAAISRLARIHFFEDRRLAAQQFGEALAEAGDDLALRAESEQGLAMAMLYLGEDLTAAYEHARAGVALAERVGDEAALAKALGTLAMIEGTLGREEAIAHGEQAVALEGSTLHLRVMLQPSWMLAQLLVWRDAFDAARSIYESLHERALERGDESSLPFLRLLLSRLEELAGNWGTAERWAAAGHEEALLTGNEPARAQLAAMRALLDARFGHVDAARAAAAEATALTAAVGEPDTTVQWALGFLELSLGRPSAGYEHLSPLLERQLAAGVGEPGTCRFFADGIETMIALDRLDEAERLLDRLERRAAALGRLSALAAAARCRGLLRSSRGDLAGALAALEEALAYHERLPQPFELGRSLLVLGAIQRRAKKKSAARTSLGRALTSFDRLGARLWSERARAELTRIGGRAPSRWELTPTEERVAALVAAGRTNREVAGALSISVKTVEWNLSKIYGKLDVRSRSELAARHTPAPRA
jgi:DNA-binding CsgD family transcriptional regulator